MSDGLIALLIFLGALILAARLCLRGERRPPVQRPDDTYGRELGKDDTTSVVTQSPGLDEMFRGR